MKEIWLKLISDFDTFERSDIIDIEKYYTNVIGYNYCSLNRYYHDLTHIKNLLDFSKEFELNEKESSLLELAVWFHDVIYEPRSCDNEVNSGMMFMKFERDYLHLNSSDTIHVMRLIHVTKHDIPTRNRLENIMCDIDLRLLAANEEVYQQISKDVRKEFKHLSEDEWCNGRFVFINSMLDKELIFHTNEYCELYEDKARHNLNEEKQTLISKIIT